MGFLGTTTPYAASVASSIGSIIDGSSFWPVDTRRNRPHPHEIGRERSHQIAGTGLVTKKVSSHWEVRSMQYPHVFVCCALVPLATSAVAECLKSNVEGQSAQGQLAIGRARDAAGRPETPYILRLASNACLDANNRDQAVRRARTIHIFPADEKLRPAFRRLVGKTVVVRGSPFIAHTAHHHAPIVMQVTEINAR
jgi:Domain of unknown function (DUF4431)